MRIKSLYVLNVKVHIETVHGSYATHMFGEPLPFQCHKCHATFENQGLCERHVCFDVFVPQKSKNGKLKCEVCDHHIAKPTQYRKHYIAIHSNDFEKPFSCELCDHKTKLAAWLYEHIVRKHSDKPHVCEECGQTFAYQSLLKIHIASKHESVGHKGHKLARNHLCTVCGLSFVSASVLNRHVLKHEDRPVKCDDCDNTFEDMLDYSQHIIDTHEDIEHLGKYPCDICDQTFCHTKVLDHHYWKSHKEKCKVCHICHKKMANVTKLKRHIGAVHEDKKDYYQNYPSKCDFCDFKGRVGTSI